MDIVEKYLKAKGITLDLKVIRAYIEAAVKEMKDNTVILPVKVVDK